MPMLSNTVALSMYVLHLVASFALPRLCISKFPIQVGSKIILAPVAPSNPLSADKHQVQIVSNPLFWDKDQPHFGSSNPLFLEMA